MLTRYKISNRCQQESKNIFSNNFTSVHVAALQTFYTVCVYNVTRSNT